MQASLFASASSFKSRGEKSAAERRLTLGKEVASARFDVVDRATICVGH